MNTPDIKFTKNKISKKSPMHKFSPIKSTENINAGNFTPRVKVKNQFLIHLINIKENFYVCR